MGVQMSIDAAKGITDQWSIAGILRKWLALHLIQLGWTTIQVINNH